MRRLVFPSLISPFRIAVLALAAGCVGPRANVDEQAARLSSLDPAPITAIPLPCSADHVDALREIEIVHPSVVDPSQNGGLSSNQVAGAPWSFRTLVENLAPGGDTDDYLFNLFSSWETAQTVNGESILDRQNGIDNTILNPGGGFFAGLTNGKPHFDLANAPFELIAIANRLDLRDPSSAPTTAGEGRFVFGLKQNGSFNSMTVIFEYRLPTTLTARQWATEWHKLGALDPVANQAQYLAQLQSITARFTKRDGAGSPPHIDQIRTNEIALGNFSGGQPWQLREFNTAADGFMRPATTKNAPRQLAFNNSAALTTFINANLAALDATDTSFLQLVMPTSLPDGTAFLGGKADEVGNVWTAPGLDNAIAQDNFGLLTCSGCHLDNKPPGDVAFYQVSPTALPGNDGTGRLSSFLLTGDPSTANSRNTRVPGDLRRRATDMANVLCTGVTSDVRRTVVFVFGPTRTGQDMFIRGGFDYGFSNAKRGTACTNSPLDVTANQACSLPIVAYNNTLNATTVSWKSGDAFLDWGGLSPALSGREPSQGTTPYSPAGSPMDWTSNNASYCGAGSCATYQGNGFGNFANTGATPTWLNGIALEPNGQGSSFANGSSPPVPWGGSHYWIWDAQIDCAQAIPDAAGNRWFELKSFVSNGGGGWEADVTQTGGKPYPGGNNHYAKCGTGNVFWRGLPSRGEFALR